MRWPVTPGRCWGALDGQELGPVLAPAAVLLATVTGQDLEEDAGGVFRIAGRVAADRVISTVGPQARHGRKTAARGFDGDQRPHRRPGPDFEIITATAVTPGNSGDAEVAGALLADLLPGEAAGATAPDTGDRRPGGLRRCRLRSRAAAGNAGGRRHLCRHQGAAAARAEGPLPQGPLRHRPARRDRHLPGGPRRAHPRPRRAPCRGGQLRRGVPQLPAGSTMRHRALWLLLSS